jgi:hypothetical protein
MRNDSSDFYTSLEDAKEEIHRRWADSSLRNKVEKVIATVPAFSSNEPKAYMWRPIATPNFEWFRFIELASLIKLRPCLAEFTNDKFVSLNSDKYVLGKMPFFDRKNKKGETMFNSKSIIDFNKYDGQCISAVQTQWGESLVGFHHRLLGFYPLRAELVEVSSWFNLNGAKAVAYYHHYLTLFICHGILFENFITNEEEERFSKSVVFPAFNQVVEHFGMKPLIVQLVPHEVASDIYWRCYPVDIEEEVLRCLCQCNAKKSSEQHGEAGRRVRHGHNG